MQASHPLLPPSHATTLVTSHPLLPAEERKRQRCALFSSGSIYDHESLAFTHLPKAGGSSFQQMLTSEAKRHNRSVMNVHTLGSGRLGAGSPEATAALQEADVLVGHGSYQYMVDYLRWRPRATFVTLLRQPSNRLESLFRYRGGDGEAYARREIAQGRSLQAEYDDYLRRLDMDTTALNMHRPKATCADADVADASGHFLFCRGALSAAQVEATVAFMRARYAVVGVLERQSDTMEVLRCRVPWVEAAAFPQVNANAQTWHYPVQLHADAAAMLNATFLEGQLYARANELLTEDLECCRRQGPRPTVA